MYIDFKPEIYQSKLTAIHKKGIVLDIDETLSWTIMFWIEQMQKKFGNPENLTPIEIANKYHFCQNVPYWRNQEAAQAWMSEMRTNSEYQENLPLIEGAVEGVKELDKLVPILGYLTIRPECVEESTKKWLLANDFPDRPVICKPNDLPFTEGNKWKAKVLNMLWPNITGIVDDNPAVPTFCGSEYRGTVFLFGHDYFPHNLSWKHVIPCKNWNSVLVKVKEFQKILA